MKFNPNISDKDREFVTNGIRTQFYGFNVFLLTKHAIVESAKSITVIFDVFIFIIAMIALFISFFLLLISMT